jgi:hypothetical protein
MIARADAWPVDLTRSSSHRLAIRIGGHVPPLLEVWEMPAGAVTA